MHLLDSAEFQDKCANRAMLLEEMFDSFKKRLYKKLKSENIIKHESGLSLNATVLVNCVERYFLDIEAERVLHGTDKRFNGYRQAVFTVKWLTKLRPIITTSSIPEFISANDEFALETALTYLRIDHSAIDQVFRNFLIHSLRYGDFSEELMLAMCTLLNPDLPKIQQAEGC
jgi:hypothetical protein